MAAVMVRCPKCGTPNPDDPRRVRRCSVCHEPLGKCRYCQSYDRRMLDCTSLYHPPDLHISDPDEVRDCPYFRSALPARARRREWRALARTAAIAIVLAAGAIVLGNRLTRSPASLAAVLPLRAAVAVTDTSTREEGFDLQVLLFNPTEQPVRGVRVMVTGTQLAQLTCQYTDPPESFQGQTRHVVTARVGDLGPTEHGGVSFHFLSSKTGSVTLTVHIAAADAAGADSYEAETEIIP